MILREFKSLLETAKRWSRSVSACMFILCEKNWMCWKMKLEKSKKWKVFCWIKCLCLSSKWSWKLYLKVGQIFLLKLQTSRYSELTNVKLFNLLKFSAMVHKLWKTKNHFEIVDSVFHLDILIIKTKIVIVWKQRHWKS